MNPNSIIPAPRVASNGGTGIVLLNMGGPKTLEDVEPFLLNLFADRELLRLPWQDVLGRFIAKRRSPKVRALYDAIGGGSPILHWTETQGRALIERLDALSPHTAPHKFYVSFRYVAPFADDAVRAMQADGITLAVALSMYPQYSCTTTGSSLNELWRSLDRQGLRDTFTWSLIDRWPTHPGFVRAMADTVQRGLAEYAPGERDDVLLMFSAHSLPLSVIDRGDAYPQEVGATVERVMEALGARNPHMLTYQSEVGPVRWLGPSTETMIRRLASDKRRNVLVVPVAFTSDHIETLSEIDIEYAELAHSLGLTGFKRAPSLNDSPLFLDALAELVHEHLRSQRDHHTRYRERCPGCTNPSCRSLPNPVSESATDHVSVRAVA